MGESKPGRTVAADHEFRGPVAEVYEAVLVPLLFEPYARDMASRVAAGQPRRVLEIACGTGAATRALAGALPPETSIVATDLNQSMLDRAAMAGTPRPVEWRQADVMALPFDDGGFDAAVCQFGAMFFPDKAAAFAEVRRVLRPGGRFLFSVWDRIEANDFADTVTAALARLFPRDPPRFLARIPHGYHDIATVTADLRAGGFGAAVEVATVRISSRAESPHLPALGFCLGTPLRDEIESRGSLPAGEAAIVAGSAIAERFGSGAVVGRMQAHVVAVVRE